MFSLTGTGSGSNPPPRSSHSSIPPADHGCGLSPCVGIEDLPADVPETEGYFCNGGFFQGTRPVLTGCPLPYSHAASSKKPRRPGGTNNLFAATDSEAQSRGSFDNDLNYQHEGKEEWGDLEQWVATNTLACEHSEPF